MAQRSFCVPTILRTQCRLWVKSRHDALNSRCPLYPRKRTLAETVVMSALCQKRTSGKLSQRCCQHSKAAGQVSNQRLCLRSQRGLGLHRWVVELARPCPSAQEGTCSVRPRKKLTALLAVLRQINCQPGRKKAVAFDRDQIVGPLQQQRREEIRPRRLVSQLISRPSRRYVQPNQCFKLIIAFVTHPRVTDVIALEKFRICRRAQ